jgi:hypothetical protein
MSTVHFIMKARMALKYILLDDNMVLTIMSFLPIKEPFAKYSRCENVRSFNSDWIELSVPKKNTKHGKVNTFINISGRPFVFNFNSASFSLDMNRNCMLVYLTTDIIKNFMKFDEKMINYGHMHSEVIFGEVKTRGFVEKAYVKSVKNNNGLHYIDLKTRKDEILLVEHNPRFSVKLPFQEFIDRCGDKQVIVCFIPQMWFQNEIFGINMELDIVGII